MKLVTQELLIQWRAAVQENHQWHISHDEFDGYEESCISQMNVGALASLNAAIDAPGAEKDEREALEQALCQASVAAIAEASEVDRLKARLEASKSEHNNEAEAFRKTIKVLVNQVIRLTTEIITAKASRLVLPDPFKNSIGGGTYTKADALMDVLRSPPWPKEDQPDGTVNEVSPDDMWLKASNNPLLDLLNKNSVAPIDEAYLTGATRMDEHSGSMCLPELFWECFTRRGAYAHKIWLADATVKKVWERIGLVAAQPPLKAEGKAPSPSEPPFKCRYCGAPSWVDPSDQVTPPTFCHESDHGSPELCAEPEGAPLKDEGKEDAPAKTGLDMLFEAYDYGQFADDFDQPLAKPIRAAIRGMLSRQRVMDGMAAQRAAQDETSITVPIWGPTFDAKRVLGSLTIEKSALPADPRFVFSIGFKTMGECETRVCDVPKSQYKGPYELTCVSLISDENYLGYLRQVGMVNDAERETDGSGA